ncbi:hypothetical protein HKX48_004792 [Thoreauomyces humboldtii]|nr:hypothetical protein HKX48_004792 [Thoreauomyces humboldtii]
MDAKRWKRLDYDAVQEYYLKYCRPTKAEMIDRLVQEPIPAAKPDKVLDAKSLLERVHQQMWQEYGRDLDNPKLADVDEDDEILRSFTCDIVTNSSPNEWRVWETARHMEVEFRLHRLSKKFYVSMPNQFEPLKKFITPTMELWPLPEEGHLLWIDRACAFPGETRQNGLPVYFMLRFAHESSLKRSIEHSFFIERFLHFQRCNAIEVVDPPVASLSVGKDGDEDSVEGLFGRLKLSDEAAPPTPVEASRRSIFDRKANVESRAGVAVGPGTWTVRNVKGTTDDKISGGWTAYWKQITSLPLTDCCIANCQTLSC